ncbi:hypothetical protein PTSG_12327 [Salpingoeca rosetta]|uniref:Uncharacterized protein n=1 Tax=Salpingoeca rosetta (strain ATCC 50818 / BSB-021) TaxID=946362 RepID=F2UBE1_SALR5|nr:uncharacterized protein PTSG_12327 [Salpingoeca rosetta]EGD73807.1 hypothetical protein PTSG_12327 [Salpingoeca rosetta]|eukprot:XP_004993370.1 hypothetical protein PTSG_12327 [Salpingoeca rosetta]
MDSNTPDSHLNSDFWDPEPDPIDQHDDGHSGGMMQPTEPAVSETDVLLDHAASPSPSLTAASDQPTDLGEVVRSSRASGVRLFPEDEEVLRELVYEHCTMTADQLADHMNLEKLRRIMISLEEQLPAEQRLRDEEKVFLGPLDRDKCLENPAVKEVYDKTHIEGTRSVYRALKRNIFTLKRVVPARTTMNSEANKQKRLAFAKELHDLLLDDNVYIVYIDEMPFYLASGRNYGWAPRGDRAVHEVLPMSTMSYRTQVAMAVSHMHGLLYGKLYPPEMQNTGGDGQKKTKKALKASYTQDHFKDFLNNLLHTLWHKRQNLQLSGTKIVFLIDSAPEHGKRATEAATQMLQACDSFHLWHEWIATGRCSMTVKFISPVSPTLNLTEFYNRSLRQRANHLRKTPDFIGKLESKDIPRGQVQKTRVKVLCDIIKRAMADLQRTALKRASEARMLEEVLHVIQLNGFLDKHWRPVQLRNNKAHSTELADSMDGDGGDDDDGDDDDDDNGHPTDVDVAQEDHSANDDDQDDDDADDE